MLLLDTPFCPSTLTITTTPFNGRAALIPTALVPEVVLPQEAVAGSQLYHLFQGRLAYHTASGDKNLDTVELISFI